MSKNNIFFTTSAFTGVSRSDSRTVTPWTWTMSTTIEMREQIFMAMRNPPHPGGVVRRQCLEPLRLTVTDAAKGLGVTRQALSDLVNEKAGISVDMAIRLSKAFGSSPETWLGMQTAYDLWQARDSHGRDRGAPFRARLA